MTDWEPLYDRYDDERPDRHKIDDDRRSVPCRMCQSIFGRVRFTVRYCATCKRAFCEGEHGSFRARGFCVRCYNDASGQLKSAASN